MADLGWFNLGYQQSKFGTAGTQPELDTPTIDALASTGMVLDRMYAYKYCSPSRSSFLSGRLPIHVTQNNHNNLVTNPGGADLRMALLPQRLKEVSPPDAPYYTALVGKWHVGARSAENLPVNRGFDAHFGFLKGGEDHINQHSSDENIVFVDLWRDQAPASGENGTFSTLMYAKEAQRIIREHARTRKNRPLFLYLAWQAAHDPLEAPASWVVRTVPNDTLRQTRAKMNALVEELDQGVNNVTATLKEEGRWDNTLLIFQADNGGWITNPTLGGNNFPLRGGKVSDFEGGVRTFALVNGGYLPESLRGSTNKGLAHICDWYATFIALANNSASADSVPSASTMGNGVVPPVDALNLWPSLTLHPNNTASPRSEVPLSFCNALAQCDTPSGIGDSALISGDWKIVNGTQGGLGIWQGTRFPNASSVPAADRGCPRGCLFNLREDPYEHYDVKAVHPRIFSRLMARITDIGKTVYQTNFTVADTCVSATAAFAQHHGFLAPRCSDAADVVTPPAAAPQALVDAHVAKVHAQTFRNASGVLKYKYLVPAGPYAQMWDWDSLFMGVALLPYGSGPYFAGTFANFLDHTNVTDGTVQGCLLPSGATGTIFHAKPVVIQGAWLAAPHDPSVDFEQFAAQMKALLLYWRSPARSDPVSGLPRWYNQLESGQDNLVLSTCASDRSPACWNPAVHELVLVSADLATFLYREFQAYSLFCGRWARAATKDDAESSHTTKYFLEEQAWAQNVASEIKAAVNEHLWDDDLGYYIALNTSAAAVQAGTTRVTAKTDVLGFPLWANMSNARQAAKVRQHLMANDMLSPFGIRSTSSKDQRYNNADEIKPYSNWQGPVWVNANAVLSLGLRKYGFAEDAQEIATRVVRTLADDLVADGTWHEGYDAENGKGLAATGFLSWDTLGATWPKQLADGVEPFALVDHEEGSFSFQ